MPKSTGTGVDPMSADFIIRPARELDTSAVHSIELEQFSHPWPLQQFHRELILPFSRFLIAETLPVSRIAGFSITWVIPPTAEIHNIAIKGEYQGRGLGRKLLTAVLDSLAGEVDEVYLEVRTSNRKAISLYESAGFSCAGLRKDYYENPPEDAWVYHLRLDQK